MKLSLNVIPECPLGEIVELAVRAESLGFDRCWVYDEGLATRDVHVTMAAIGAATTMLQIGPGITNPYTRHPAQTASAVASLDEMTGGRAFLGIGAGGSLTLDPIGISRLRPLAAVRDSIEVSRKLFAGSTVDHRGPTVSLSSARMGYGRAEIEIWLAGRGPKMLALGGEIADGVMLDFIYKPSLASYVERVRSRNQGARICYSTAIVTGEDDLEFVRPHMTYRLVDSPAEIRGAIGMSDEDVARIRAAMSDGLEAAASHVRDEWVLPFVISGSVTECAAEVDRLCSAHGIEEFLVPMFDMADQHDYLTRLASALR